VITFTRNKCFGHVDLGWRGVQQGEKEKPWMLSSSLVIIIINVCNSVFTTDFFFFFKYCNGVDQCDARQQLCKHSPAPSNRGSSVCHVWGDVTQL
jgi:hypothetical protein